MVQPLPLFWQRYSCRRFLDTPLPAGALESVLEAARWAPSAGNLQPWRFHVTACKAVQRALAEAAFGQEFLMEAPVVIAVCALPERCAKKYGERGRSLYCLQDTAAAVQNILLEAARLGLGSCWVGAFQESAASLALNLPAGERPVALVPLGYPGEPMPQERSRLPLEQTVRRVE
jgi:nitroreductase